MCEFKVGDRVKCIDSTDNSSVILGEVCVISGFRGEYVTLEGKTKSWDYFFPERFELIATDVAEEKAVSFKNGDVIEYQGGGEWRSGFYIGVVPNQGATHALQAAGGHVITRERHQFRKPKVKKVAYVGVYYNGAGRTIFGEPFDTREEAEISNLYKDSIAKVEWEE